MKPALSSLLGVFVCGLIGCGSKSANVPQQSLPASASFKFVTLSPGDGELGVLLKGEVVKAKASGRKAFAYGTADWCPPCRAIAATLNDERMIDAFDGTYIIKLDVDEWDEKLQDNGFDAGSIPVFFELNEDGKFTGRRIDGGAWGDNVPENMAPPLKEFFRG